MNDIQISKLFTSLGIKPNHLGRSYLVYLIQAGSCCKGPFPRMKDLYQQAAEHFGVPKDRIEYNVRTVVRSYWNQKDSKELFSTITHYPVTDYLTVKEFVSILCEYAATH